MGVYTHVLAMQWQFDSIIFIEWRLALLDDVICLVIANLDLQFRVGDIRLIWFPHTLLRRILNNAWYGTKPTSISTFPTFFFCSHTFRLISQVFKVQHLAVWHSQNITCAAVLCTWYDVTDTSDINALYRQYFICVPLFRTDRACSNSKQWQWWRSGVLGVQSPQVLQNAAFFHR